MVDIRNPDSVFEYDADSPSTAVSGSKTTAAHCWKYCPYSTQITNYSGDSRIPDVEKTFHSETSGFLHSYSLGGPMGWACADNGCSYFLTTATTALKQNGRKFVATSIANPTLTASGCVGSLPTLSGSVNVISGTRTIVSGIRQRYFEI